MNYNKAFDIAFSGNDLFLVLECQADAQKDCWWLPYYYLPIECCRCNRITTFRRRIWFGLFDPGEYQIKCNQCSQENINDFVVINV